jgi:SAM-dependent methyltransferase
VFELEARWIAAALARLPPERLTPLLNLGSSDRRFREVEQPWVARELFAPLESRGVRIVHSDLKQGEGIDVSGDVFDETVFATLKAARFRALLCCNLLEHVPAPDRLAARCEDIVEPGGYIVVTVPHSYPHHRDPIDTMFRPSPAQVAALFPRCRAVDSAIIEPGSYRDDVRRRPWILFRHVFRAPFPFLGYERWRHSMRKLYWLAHPYQVSCVVFERGDGQAE